MRNIDPDSEENQAVQRQNDREVFALQMQAKYPNGITDEEVKLYDEIHADQRRSANCNRSVECESCGAKGDWLPLGQFDAICPKCGGNTKASETQTTP